MWVGVSDVLNEELLSNHTVADSISYSRLCSNSCMFKLKDVVIRQFQLRDLRNVQQLYLEGMHSYEHPKSVKEDLSSYAKSRIQEDMSDIQRYYLDVDGGNFWVAEETKLDSSDLRIVGCVGVLPECLAETGSNENENVKSFELLRMSVHEDYRGKDLAQALVNKLESYVRKECTGTRIFLSTLTEMKRTCNFYEKAGYLKVGEPEVITVIEEVEDGDTGVIHVQEFEKRL